MDHDNIDWDLVSKVKSRRRRAVVTRLADQPATSSELAEEMGVSASNVRRALLFLRQKGLATCLTPDRPYHRIYGLTETGETVADLVA